MYEYDKNGNRIKTGGSFARTGIPQAVGSTAYDAANQQTTFADKTLTYDNNGNLQTITDSGGTTTYTWNARNQLVAISGPSVNASFVYDGLGRREAKTVNGNLTEFLYDRLNPVQESSGGTILANILPGLGIDEFLTRTDVVAGLTSNFLTESLGSPIAVTDNSGVVQTEYTYEPFGTISSTGVSNTNPYQYAGRENDGTGLFYYRARYYHPRLQRFISEDPINPASVQVTSSDDMRSVVLHQYIHKHSIAFDLYNYVKNNPETSKDPLGLYDASEAIDGALSNAAGGAIDGSLGSNPVAGGTVGALFGGTFGLIPELPGTAMGATIGAITGISAGIATEGAAGGTTYGDLATAAIAGGLGGAAGGFVGGPAGTVVGIAVGMGVRKSINAARHMSF